MPWTCIRCESINIDSDDTCEVCDERRGLNLPQQRQSIAAGDIHSLAITSRGKVIGWGDNSRGQTNIPEGLSDVIAVAVGTRHSLALTAHGKVIEWGSISRVLDLPYHLNNNVVAISAGAVHSLALRADGTVFAWGNNSEGQCDVPETLNSVIAIAAGAYHSLALRVDGTVVAWGEKDVGQCNVPNHLNNVIAIAAGESYSYALTNTGKLVTLGGGGEWSDDIPTANTITAHYYHYLALTKDKTVISSNGDKYPVPSRLRDVVEIATGESHFLVRQSNGTVIAWGNNDHQQCTVPSILTQSSYLKSTIAAGHKHSLAITATGTVTGWGSNLHGQIDIPEGLSDIVAVAAGNWHSLALTSNGQVIEWGLTSWKIGLPKHLNHNVVSISAGDYHSLALRADGTVFAWGDNDRDQCDIPTTLNSVIAIAAGATHSLALRANGTVVAWGDNEVEQCDVPDDLTDVVAIAAGLGYSYALTDTGTLVTWGNEDESTNIPAAITIAAHDYHYIGLTKDKTVITSDDARYPIPSELRGVVEIAMGSSHYLARQSNGTVIAWGSSEYEQCEVPPIVSTPIIKSIACSYYGAIGLTTAGRIIDFEGDSFVADGISGATQIAIGDDYVMALYGDETICVWQHSTTGNSLQHISIPHVTSVAACASQYFALKGDGTVVEIIPRNSTPPLLKPLPRLRHIRSIAVGWRHVLALTSSGTVIAWGKNDEGQCTVPLTLDSVIAIAVGDSHSLALCANGTVVAWGDNSHGQCDVPKDLRNVSAISAGYGYSVVLKADGYVQMFGDYSPNLPSTSSSIKAIAACGNRTMCIDVLGKIEICNNSID